MPVSFEFQIEASSAVAATKEMAEIIDSIAEEMARPYTPYENEVLLSEQSEPIPAGEDLWSFTVVYRREKSARHDMTDAGLAWALCELLGNPWVDDLTFQELQENKTATIRTYRRSGPQSGSRYHAIISATCQLGKSGNNCFIATAACGTADAPDVETLRSFRDAHLRPNLAGRLFVRCYETWSPELAAMIDRRPRYQTAIRRILIGPLASVARQWMSR